MNKRFALTLSLAIAAISMNGNAFAQNQDRVYPIVPVVPVKSNAGVISDQGQQFLISDLQDQAKTTSQDDKKQTIENYLRPIQELTANGSTKLKQSKEFDRPKAVAPPVKNEIPRSSWADSTMVWQVPDICHRHLYFEDRCLERFGYHRGVWQPSISAARFLFDVNAFPGRAVRYPYRSLNYYPLQRYNDPSLYCW